ncbi:MAG: GAF domain-containing protein [Cytophagales bacterium]|nr:GAF domain-containing protein [Bernardetiaceae bacterium]MDW8209612.1 GAF domain-containing protein [Cytophagales bacterium]
MRALNLHLSLRLYLAISLILVIGGGIVLRQLWINRLDSEYYARQQLLYNASVALLECGYIAQLVMRTPEDDNLRNQFSIVRLKVDNLMRILLQGGTVTPSTAVQPITLEHAQEEELIRMQQLISIWQEVRKALEQLETNMLAASSNSLNPVEYRNQLNAIGDFLTQNLIKLDRNIELAILKTNLKLQEEETSTFAWLYTYLVILSIHLIAGFVYFRDLIVKPLKKIIQKVLALSEGKNSEEIILSSGSAPEMILLSKGVNQLDEIQRSMAEFASQVGRGNYNHSFTARSKDDILGLSLLAMRDNLMRADKEDAIRSWANEGQVKFGDIFRKHADDLEKLAYHTISELVKYVGANQGFFFVLEGEGEKAYLELIAAYAYEKRKYLTKQVPVGSGLLGQAVLEKQSLYFTDIPQNYVTITSGLGEATPSCLMITPLLVGEVVYGAIEIAGFQPFEPHQINFIEKIASDVASTLAFTKASEKTRKLLEESQMFAEQMRAQEEEMRQNMEELVATQEEMQRIQAEIRKKEASLSNLINNTDTFIFSLDKGFNLLLANDAFKRYIKSSLGIDLHPGMNMLNEVVPEATRQIRRQQYERALAGESFTVIENHKGKDHSDNYYEISFQPIYTQANQIEGVSVFMRNITHLNPIRWEF